MSESSPKFGCLALCGQDIQILDKQLNFLLEWWCLPQDLTLCLQQPVKLFCLGAQHSPQKPNFFNFKKFLIFLISYFKPILLLLSMEAAFSQALKMEHQSHLELLTFHAPPLTSGPQKCLLSCLLNINMIARAFILHRLCTELAKKLVHRFPYQMPFNTGIIIIENQSI